jgi:glycosyltransferase involved in cell wall biosynthesis
MRILQVTTYFPPDKGIENPYVRELTDFLRNDGHDVEVLTRFWRLKFTQEWVHQLYVPKWEMSGYLMWMIQSWPLVNLANYDVVHLHSFEGHVSGMFSSPHVPKILHMHNSPLRETGFYDGWRHSLGLAVVRAACKRADFVITPTEAVRQDLLRSVPRLSHRAVRAIPNFVDTRRFRPGLGREQVREEYEIGDKILLLYFGRIKEEKGIREICEAFEMIKEKGPFALMVAGSPRGNQAFFNELRSKHPDVIFTGTVRDPVPYYTAADAFCIYISGYAGGETFAIALAEAMACGLPSICSDISVFREVTKGNAAFAPPRQVAALAKAMLLLLQDSKKMMELGIVCRRIAEEDYSVTRVGPRLEAVYEAAVDSR